MLQKAERLKSDLIDKVAALVRERLDADKAALAEEFVRRYYANVGVDDLRHRDAAALYGAALAIWGFGARRPARTAKLRVYNPRLEEHGWKSSHTIIEIVNDDMPFLVDSVTAELNSRDISVHLVIHPILRVCRDKGGRLLRLACDDDATPPKGAVSESFMHIEISEQPAEAHEEIRAALAKVLADVRATVEDWRAMRGRIDEIIGEIDAVSPPVAEEETAEVRAFLEWIRDDRFTFLGMRSYELVSEAGDDYLRPIAGTGLGLLREVSAESAARHAAPLSPQVAAFARRKELLIIAKTSTRSTVHRAVPLDFIGLRRFDEKGEVVGEHRIVGLFTSMAYSQSPRYIPVTRQKVKRTIERAGFLPDSHDGKALLHILESYPRDELFQISESELLEISLGILRLQQRQRIALFVRRDPFARYNTCLVYVPRDRYNTELRRKIQDILEKTFDGKATAYYTHLGDEPLARLHFVVTLTPESPSEYDIAEIEAEIAEASRSWRDRLQEALVQEKGEGRGLALLRRYGDAFSAGYRDHFSPQAAVSDIERVEETRESGDLGINLYRLLEAPGSEVRLKIYHAGDPVTLSDVLPMLEHMGFKVISEMPYAVTPAADDHPVWVHEFGMRSADGAEVDLSGVKGNFQDCLARVWSGAVEDDNFNRMVVTAGLPWREVVMLRAYCKFLRQASVPFSEAYMQQTLACNPELVGLIVALFKVRFDPARRRRAEGRAVELKSAIEEALDRVANLDEDRILRLFFNLVLATLRTNYFQHAESGEPKPYISFKFDSQAIEELPLPRPMYEIFVYSPHVEAVHLRGGKVARGGLRWSDRREDFRTEVLGLMKAQMVKNTVIVPVGSKGGFVVKRPPDPGLGREALSEEVVACYKTMIHGMLDLTDNLDGDKVRPPPDLVRFDDDDAYLVVAADKGTATFSDIANGVSEARGFWLGDAFASGGSVGYDHKKMGITARGAWESVKRHFREMGRDIQKEDFTVVGVGDMGGDVFGNGMLLSKHIRLVAAFNHLHIFIDPDPDPKASFEERRRLFDTPRSAWTDYGKELISKGGGVFDRKAKAITLTPEMKALFGLSGESMTPAELIRALLRAEVDLLWFGGIGTFVKAAGESDLEVGDRANDALRVDATALRCRVIGEGANLGLTQRGRIEYALGGGRINTDAIDNSAGVDCSDHEVNIKILFGDLVARGDMTRKQRDALLEKMTDEVSELVLRDNYLQTQAITIAEADGVELLDQYARLMRNLERAGRLDRALEALPDEEALEERRNARRGLTRPEIAVLLAYAKLALYEELLPAELPDDPLLGDDLLRYFPQPLQKKHKSAIARHRLRREIIATSVTNSLVNRAGSVFVNEMKERTGMGADDIARAYAVTRDVFGLRPLWGAIEALDNKVSAAVQTTMHLEIGRLVERGTLWFLRNGAHPIDITHDCACFGPCLETIAGCLDSILTPGERDKMGRRAAGLVEQKVPKALARRIACLDVLASSLDVARIALAGKYETAQVGRIYFDIGARFGLDWLRAAAAELVPEDWWEKEAIAAIVEDFHGHQSALTARVLGAAGGGDIGPRLIDAWAETRHHAVERSERLLGDLKAAQSVDLAMLAVANRQIRAMIGA